MKVNVALVSGCKVIVCVPISNSTYLCARSYGCTQKRMKAESGTQAVFIRLKGINRYHCGAIKIKIKFTVAAHEIIILAGQVVYDEYRMEIEQTFLIPIFIRD